MSLASLIATGTKVWLDGVAPEDIKQGRALGVTGATSNPTIVSQIIGSGHFDDRIVELARQGHDDAAIACRCRARRRRGRGVIYRCEAQSIVTVMAVNS